MRNGIVIGAMLLLPLLLVMRKPRYQTRGGAMH